MFSQTPPVALTRLDDKLGEVHESDQQILARRLSEGNARRLSEGNGPVSGRTNVAVLNRSSGQDINIDDLAKAITESMSNQEAAKKDFFYQGDGPHPYTDDRGISMILDFRTKLDLIRKNPAPKMVTVLGHDISQFFVIQWIIVPAIIALMVVITVAVMLTLPGPTERVYFIGVDEVEWDYAPKGMDVCHNTTFGYKAKKFVSPKISIIPGDSRIGSKYTKARFVQYTDGSFTKKKELGPDWAHLGLLGPPIRAEVGERIKVVLKNNARFVVSLTTHAGMGQKTDEGIGYNDGTISLFKKDDGLDSFGLGQVTCKKPQWVTGDRRRLNEDRSFVGWWTSHALIRDSDFCLANDVKHGETHLYTWDVQAKHGPGPNDPSSIVWSYQSHTGGQGLHHHSGGQGVGDVNAGLIGPVIISRKGASRTRTGKDTNLMPKDVDREFVLLNHVVDENDSPYLESNIYKYITKPAMGSFPRGYVPFGNLDKVRVLQELYRRAADSMGQDKLSYADAKAILDTALAKKVWVDEVRGQYLRVWFDESNFDPEKYDAVNGGQGIAEEVLLGMYRQLADPIDPLFQESNLMHGQNGYVYCNQPVMKAYQGERVRWYNIAVGNNWDMHTPHWHGNSLLVDNGFRVDEIDMLAGTSQTADMDSLNPGTWLLHCHVNDHIMAGMSSIYEIAPSKNAATAALISEVNADTGVTVRSDSSLALDGKTRKYYIALDEIEWNYMSGAKGTYYSSTAGFSDKCTGSQISAEEAQTISEDGGVHKIGTTYRKVQYTEYTDATFTTKKSVAAEWEHLQLLGPTLRAEVGDMIEVAFKNNARFNYSMHPHGVHYPKTHEGAAYTTSMQPDDVVQPGKTFVYKWQVPESAGPGPADLSSNVWLYHSHTREVNDTNAGAVGTILVSRKGEADWARAGIPKGVDKEFVLLVMSVDEGKSDFVNYNMKNYLPNFAGNDLTLDEKVRAAHTYRLQKSNSFKKSNKMRSINGKSWCSLPGISFKAGEKVRWHTVSLGDETPHFISWEGHTVNWHGHTVTGMELMAASMKTADMTATVPGDWLLYSQVYKDVHTGMKAKFEVVTAGGAETVKNRGTVRRYVIGADEVEWDYLPFGESKCVDKAVEHLETEETLDFIPEVELYTKAAEHRIGSKYVKAQYREYRNADYDKLEFGQYSRRNEVSEHLGLLGPVIRAKPGDVISVLFKNFLRFPCNFYIHGLQAVDGFADPTKPVAPGEKVEYRWKVTEQAYPSRGKGGRDSGAIAFMYESTAIFSGTGAGAGAGVDSIAFAGADAGLFGAVLINTDGTFPGREFVTIFNEVDENKSPYLHINTLKHDQNHFSVVKNHPVFRESNRMRNINGFMFCNMPHLSAPQSRDTRWFVLARGSEKSVYAPRWSGQALQVYGKHVSTVELMPGSSNVVHMKPEKFGHWLLQDQNRDNARAGMQALFQVNARIAAGATGEYTGSD